MKFCAICNQSIESNSNGQCSIQEMEGKLCADQSQERFDLLAILFQNQRNQEYEYVCISCLARVFSCINDDPRQFLAFYGKRTPKPTAEEV